VVNNPYSFQIEFAQIPWTIISIGRGESVLLYPCNANKRCLC